MKPGVPFDAERNLSHSVRSLFRPSVKSVYGFILITALMLSSCAGMQPPAPQAGTRVLAAETFLADIAQNVAGQRLHVDSLLAPGMDPHEFQPSPQDAIRIARSQVLILNGLDYETWLSNTLDAAGGQRILIVASEGLPASPTAQGAVDPHMWMNPLNAVQYVQNIRDGLTRADPAGKDAYAANADAYISRLKDLDSSIRSRVSALPNGKRLLVTNHDALGYFAKAYDFQVVGLVIRSVTNEVSPSAQQMAALIDTLKRTGAPAIFLDVSENQNLARQIASATGAKVVTDLYVETLSAPDGPAPTYIAMLQHDVTSIVDALK
jgi:zinc/manganese transport system substrate-binding protein